MFILLLLFWFVVGVDVMDQDRLIGYLLLVVSIAGLGVYGWLLFLAPPGWAWVTVQVSALVAVEAALLIVAWIGYTMATTPPPTPIEDMDLEFDEGPMVETGGEGEFDYGSGGGGSEESVEGE